MFYKKHSVTSDIESGIFLVLKKAFDAVNHKILLDKLNHYGIRGLALDFFTSYLKNGQQFVFANGVQSDKMQITCGVPQGSTLGPVHRSGARHFHLGGPLEGPVLQQGELSMVCVGLSERDLLQWHDVTRKILGEHWGGKAKFGGAVAPLAPP